MCVFVEHMCVCKIWLKSAVGYRNFGKTAKQIFETPCTCCANKLRRCNRILNQLSVHIKCIPPTWRRGFVLSSVASMHLVCIHLPQGDATWNSKFRTLRRR